MGMRSFEKKALCLWAVVGLFLSMAATAHASTKFTLTLAHQFGADSIPGEIATEFARRVKEETNGQVIISVYPNAEMGDERANFLNLKNGNLDIAITGDLFISNYFDDYRILNVPFVMRSPKQALQAYDKGLDKTFSDQMKRIMNVDILSYYFLGTRHLTSSIEIKSRSDLQKLKLRLPPIENTWAAAWRELGVRYEFIPFPELVEAFEATVVNAQENPVNLIISKRLYEHQKYLYLTNHYFQRQFFLVRSNLYSSMPKPFADTLSSVAKQLAMTTSSRAQEREKEGLIWIKENSDMIVSSFPVQLSKDQQFQIADEVGGKKGVQLLKNLLAN
jgi:TRAP-type C4-dicarboxylate transport system substrate-binding protein